MYLVSPDIVKYEAVTRILSGNISWLTKSDPQPVWDCRWYQLALRLFWPPTLTKWERGFRSLKIGDEHPARGPIRWPGCL